MTDESPAEQAADFSSQSKAPQYDHFGHIGLIRIDHVGVAVADLEAAIALYERVFGMRCVHRETNHEQSVREAMLCVGPTPDGGYLQLLAPLSAASPIAKFLDRHGPGMQQIAYTVTDVDETSAELRRRGVRLLYDTPRPGTAGSRINFVHPKDAGGVLVEIVQPATTQSADRGFGEECQ